MSKVPDMTDMLGKVDATDDVAALADEARSWLEQSAAGAFVPQTDRVTKGLDILYGEYEDEVNEAQARMYEIDAAQVRHDRIKGSMPPMGA